MVASHALLQETPESIVLEMTQHMEVLVTNRDWPEIERLSARLHRALLDVPESRRRSLVLLVQRCTERVASEVTNARSEVTGQISALRRGQAAAKAYELR